MSRSLAGVKRPDSQNGDERVNSYSLLSLFFSLVNREKNFFFFFNLRIGTSINFFFSCHRNFSIPSIQQQQQQPPPHCLGSISLLADIPQSRDNLHLPLISFFFFSFFSIPRIAERSNVIPRPILHIQILSELFRWSRPLAASFGTRQPPEGVIKNLTKQIFFCFVFIQ